MNLRKAITRAKTYGGTPRNGPTVVQAYREGELPNIDILGLHVIGELLDRIEGLERSLSDMLEDGDETDRCEAMRQLGRDEPKE